MIVIFVFFPFISSPRIKRCTIIEVLYLGYGKMGVGGGHRAVDEAICVPVNRNETSMG